MVKTRSTGSGSGQQQGQNNQGTGIPMPPPLTPEQYFQLQMQMMASINRDGHFLLIETVTKTATENQLTEAANFNSTASINRRIFRAFTFTTARLG